LELHNVNAEAVNYQARAAVRVKDAARADVDDAKRLAIIPGTLLQDGAIEIILSGDTTAEASAQARGFVGIAFRVSGDRTHFECFYLRPKNGRSEDQLQRNHSTQYISVPGFPWNKLRVESPPPVLTVNVARNAVMNGRKNKQIAAGHGSPVWF
jgi:hypothetical protein